MTWHAQLEEDKFLAELLDFRERGFYIDVGAQHPIVESVTWYFYERGWFGINIEPHPAYFTELVIERRRDINLPFGVDDIGGGKRRAFTAIPGTGLSTFNEHYAAKWTPNYEHESLMVPMYTLSEICETYVPFVDGKRVAIDFMKIDVEGFEEAVIRGANWNTFRPEILCIEAIEPLSGMPSHSGWEPIILEAGYAYLEDDLLNRWYRRID